MMLSMKVTTSDGTRTITSRPKTMVQWEAKTGHKMSDLANGIAMSDLAWIAWRQLTDEGMTTATYDEWMDDLDNLEPVFADPTGLPEGASSE